MSYYHIIIATEKRNPTITEEYMEYVGEWIDGAMATPLDMTCWEKRTRTVSNPRLATPIAKSEPTGNTIETQIGPMPEYVAGPVQLHSFSAAGLPENFDTDPQFVMVVEWDGSAPYVIQHKGDYADRTMGFAGWPDLTKEQYDALVINTFIT